MMWGELEKGDVIVGGVNDSVWLVTRRGRGLIGWLNLTTGHVSCHKLANAQEPISPGWALLKAGRG